MKNKLVCDCGNDRFIAAGDREKDNDDQFVCTQCGQIIIAYKPKKNKTKEKNYYYEYRKTTNGIYSEHKS